MMKSIEIKVGVLAIQGAFIEHIKSLNCSTKEINQASQNETILVEVVEIRNMDHINDDLDGLIIPGGESTVMQRYLKESETLKKLVSWTRQKNKFTWGTCAGLILLSNKVVDNEAVIGGLDITCTRNAFGRQGDSFETTLSLDYPKLCEVANSTKCHGIFIRAPQVKSINGDHVTVLCSISEELCCEGRSSAVGVQQNNIMANTFHIELTSDLSWHKYFIRQVISQKYPSLCERR